MHLPVLLLLLLITAPTWGAEAPAFDPATAARMDSAERAHVGLVHLRDRDDPASAYPWLESAAEYGSSVASANLGWMHEEGHGVERDGARASYWYGKAAEQGALRYAVHLGWMYLEGRLVERSRSEAEVWFRYAVERDLPEARLALGSVLYADMLGGRDELGTEAEALLLDALEDGLILATRFLGRMYLDGTGVPQDVARGESAVRLGAESGDADMQSLLALLLVRGDLIEADAVEAYKWAVLAAAAGDGRGMQLRQYLESDLLADAERAEALTDARQWARQKGAPMPRQP